MLAIALEGVVSAVVSIVGVRPLDGEAELMGVQEKERAAAARRGARGVARATLAGDLIE